jgi:hypothetical protein
MDFTTSSSGVHPGNIKCDWLDITFPPDCGLMDEACGFLSALGATATRKNDQVLDYRLPTASWGNFQLGDSGRGWARLSASGGSLEALRGLSAFGEYLSLLGSFPHSVTRLDACLDLRVPAPPVIQALVARYPPDSVVHLTRKGVRPSYHLQPSPCGGLTGTFYIGHGPRSRSHVSGRVYDKRAERLFRTGEDPGPWLRYEITVRRSVNSTLRDASDPAALFWHFASPSLLSAPPGHVPWSPFLGDAWAPGPLPKIEPYQRIKKLLDVSPDISHLIQLADGLSTDGRHQLLRLFRSRLGLRSAVHA